MSEDKVGEWLNLFLTLFFFGTVFWLAWRKRRGKAGSGLVPDGPEDAPYLVYTRQYDRELSGHDLDRALLTASPDYASGWLKLSRGQWSKEIDAADQLVDAHRQSFLLALGELSALKGRALTLLVDQSGSMRDEPMRWAAVSCWLVAEALEEIGCSVEILGFSTAGWQGGFCYQQWKDKGRPRRPGRLCALLHIVYKSHSQRAFQRADWEAMLNPNVLRENVDGEALEWAANRLKMVECRKWYLVVLSDGAPVDDATMMHNGPSYLARHLKSVIATLRCDDRLDLSAVGIGYAVSGYYEHSTKVDDLTQLPVRLGQWIGKLGRAADIQTPG